MACEWSAVPLRELYSYSSGLSKPRSEFGFGHGFLTFKEVLDNTFVPNDLSSLVNSTDRERERCSIRRGDVFLTRTSETQADLGMSCVALKDYGNATFNGFTKRLRPKNKKNIYPEFAAYVFGGPAFRAAVTSMSSLSTRASLNNEMLDRLTIVVPPWDDQRTIAAVLKSLDDKIELNRRMNRTLEEMARALFKSWFVDFDPVHANAAGTPTLPADLAALFPSEFEPSPIGDVPKGWKLSPVGEAVECVGGGTPSTKRSDYWENGVHHWATPKDLSNLNSPLLIDTARKLTDAGIDKISSGLLPVGTVLLSSRAPVGYLAIATIPVGVNQGFIALKPQDQLPPPFLLLWCAANMDTIKGQATGTTFAEISKKAFRPIPMCVPPQEVTLVFSEQVQPWFDQVLTNHRESRTLAALRDALLPKLLSGELSVADAEDRMAAAD